MSNERIAGINPIIEALKSGRAVSRILISEQRKTDRDIAEIIRLAKTRGVEIRVASRDVLKHEAPEVLNQGVVAIAAAHRYADLDDILGSSTAQGKSPLFLVLDGVEDPRNLGAIIRTADAAGVDAVIIPERRAAGLTETVAKTAAGALEYVPVVKVVNIAQTLETLKKSGIWLSAAEAEGTVPYWEADFSGPTALVLGGEDKGVRRLVRERCDFHVSIPLMGKINSLNVSVAAGVLLYEVLRQRKVAS